MCSSEVFDFHYQIRRAQGNHTDLATCLVVLTKFSLRKRVPQAVGLRISKTQESERR